MSSRPAIKRVPQRTCAACRSTRPKREMVRLVRAASPTAGCSEGGEEPRGGAVEVDTTGKKEGRGTYLCRDRACWEKALKGAGLEKALRCHISRENRERLMEAGQKLIEESTIG